jgi:hypothetical protein
MSPPLPPLKGGGKLLDPSPGGIYAWGLYTGTATGL